MGNRRQRAGLVLRQAFRLRDRVKWPHSSSDAEGRRQAVIPHGDVNCIPATCSRNSSLSRTHEGTSPAVAESPGDHGRKLPGERQEPRHCRLSARGFVSFGQDCWLKHDTRKLCPRNKRRESKLSK